MMHVESKLNQDIGTVMLVLAVTTILWLRLQMIKLQIW
jgi:hypothetical protein